MATPSKEGQSQPVEQAHARYRAIQFLEGQSFKDYADVLKKLIAEGPFEFDAADENTLVFPQWSFQRFTEELDRRGILYEEIPVEPMSSLPPEEQATLRGLNWKEK